MNSKITNQDLALYFEWSVEAVRGKTPIRTNAFMMAHIDTIKACALYLLTTMKYKPKPIYRGVVFKDGSLKELVPHPNFMYLSFTEDENIAKWFADPGPSGFGLGADTGTLGEHGYIIHYTPKIEEILFHWHFFGTMPYMQALASVGVDGRSLPRQKEVVVYQPNSPLSDIKKFDPNDPLYNPPQKGYDI